VLVLVAVPLLAATSRTLRFSNFAYTCLFAFFVLHEIGAHYTYSEVPWREWLHLHGAGTGPDSGGRNHYDRFVHFAYGVLVFPAVWELFAVRANPQHVWRYVMPVTFLLAHSVVYELIEWGAAAMFGGALGAALILASIVSCLNATILVGPRIAYAMALDGLFFAGVDRVHAANQTPHVAIVAQALTAIALIVVLERFPSVLDYTTFAIVLATMADTTALYALRRRRPNRPRPYRAWGYPLLPALYLVANGAIAVAMLTGRPLECAVALAVTASGLPFYYRFARLRV
jgi:amino acid transporter